MNRINANSHAARAGATAIEYALIASLDRDRRDRRHAQHRHQDRTSCSTMCRKMYADLGTHSRH